MKVLYEYLAIDIQSYDDVECVREQMYAIKMGWANEIEGRLQ
jgi:hypothetical protein